MTACENSVEYNIFYAHRILIHVYMYMYNTCTQGINKEIINYFLHKFFLNRKYNT